MLTSVIAEKERTIALYSSLIADGGEKLTPFRDRHQAHVNELRKHVRTTGTPPPSPDATSPSPGTSPPSSPGTTAASPSPSDAAQSPKASLSRLRDLERKAAALRTRQLGAAGVSPGVAQLIASIGACEAAHAVALPRSL
ncbi:MAG TPA: hypothetical protein VFV66_03380 [Nonomuraea sp.]|nr:hypothetical protein [Nonomuraea sp.]